MSPQSLGYNNNTNHLVQNIDHYIRTGTDQPNDVALKIYCYIHLCNPQGKPDDKTADFLPLKKSQSLSSTVYKRSTPG